MRILITGAGGLVGRALTDRGALGRTHAELDVTSPDAVWRALELFQPAAVIFCAAIADVDACACDPRALVVNVEAPIACARRVPTWLVSTNYVFDGPGPHAPNGARHPVNAYGRQKVEAEDGVLAAGGHVVRTGWVFGPGGKNFPSQIFQALSRGPVNALAGWPVQPTWVGDLADRLLELRPGITHAIGSGQTTWFHFARTARQLLGRGGPVRPSKGLPVGPRPTDARLFGADLPSWRDRLPLFLQENRLS